MQMTLTAPHSLFEKKRRKTEAKNKLIADKLERHIAAEARKEAHERLLNWARWYRHENGDEMDKATGYRKNSTIGKFMDSVRGVKSLEENSLPDDEDANRVNAAIQSLGMNRKDNEYSWIIHLIYIEQVRYEEIAEVGEWSMSQVKSRVRDMRDRMAGLLK